MDIIALIGMVGGFVVIVIGVLVGGASLWLYWDPPSVFITLGGTITSVLLSFPLEAILTAFKAFPVIIKGKKFDTYGAIGNIISLASTARREGLLFLEDSVKELGDPFLQKGILLIVDGTDPELVKGILETDLSYMEERHEANKAVFDAFASFAPAFGMIGTLIGLINMLADLADPSALGPAMATSLITTMYGCIIANVIFTPVANRLAKISSDEVLYRTILIEGVLSIQAGENPRIIEEKLVSFLSVSNSGKARPSENTPEAEEM